MKRKDNPDLIKAFHRLTDAAEAYVNRSPRVKRIQEQRSALLDAIADAQLFLSVHQLPKESSSERSGSKDNRTPMLERELKSLQHTFEALDRNLRPVSMELEALQQRAGKAKALLESALVKHRPKNDSRDVAQE
jgi:predicted  nucleic acid-binding Zn-ribbon protein